MLIPLGTDRPLRRTPVVTYALLALNIVAFLAQRIATQNLPTIIDGEVARFVLDPGNSGWWTWLTYAFLHGGIMHLLGNMLFFWVFGQAVEDRLGHIGFAAFYLIGAVATGLGHALFRDNPVVGASGAVACCTGAYLVMFPRAGVRVLFLFILIGFFVLPAWIFIALAIAKDLFLLGVGVGGIAVEAHLAGYAYGFAVGFALLASGVVQREPYDLFTTLNQKRRRGKIRSAVRSAGMDNPMAAKPERGARRERKPTPEEEAAQLVQGIERSLKDRRIGSAVSMYRRLTDEHAEHTPSLDRDTQLDLANALYQKSEHELAARAYQGFLDTHGDDGEAPMVRVLLARILIEESGDRAHAESLLRQALDDLDDPQLRTVAQEQLDALSVERA